jgi:hypothetical protein
LTLDDFVILDNPFEDQWWWLTLSQRVMVLDSWRDYLRGDYTGAQPVPLRIMKGRRKPQVIGSDTRLKLISGELHSVLRASGATGLSTHPTVVYDKSDEKIVDRECVWLKLKVGCGPVNKESGYFLMEFGGGSKDPDRLPIGYHFDVSTWKGLDIFEAENWSSIIVTRRIADAIRAAKIEGVVMESAAEYGDRTRRSMNKTFRDRHELG